MTNIGKLINQTRKQKEKILDQEQIIKEQTEKIRTQLNKVNLDGKLEYFK